MSEGLEAASGVKPAELLGAKRLSSQAFDAEPEASTAYQQCVQARRPFRDFTYGYTRPDGVKRYIRISGEPVFGEAGNFAGYRGVGRDVTTVTEAQLKVHELARFDSLTGLPNRSMFLGELDQAIARGKRHGLPFAVCFIDLDRFKAINDRLGHAAGDELLRTMAGRLRGALRETDLVARLGGDEFVVLLDGNARTAALEATAGKLLQALAEPVTMRGCNFAVSGSIGVATFPEDGADAALLLQHADAAMYQAKRHGRNEVRFYTSDLADMSSRDFETESALRLALVRDELVLHYQPKMEAAGARMVGMEALVRWRHPTRGMVPPMEFIPLAEERGLIVPIGRWVMQAACRQVRLWRDAGLVPVPVAINLSALQFASESLMRDLRDAMAEHGVTAKDLEVELTESVLMADPARASDLLQQMHEMGLRISIDDFGTGYSSLSYLKRFPAQMVKVDRSFVGGLPADANDKAITEAVIALAHSLGLGVVAEGVETEAQLALLRQLGCDEVQGYLTGRPMPADAMAQRLEAR